MQSLFEVGEYDRARKPKRVPPAAVVPDPVRQAARHESKHGGANPPETKGVQPAVDQKQETRCENRRRHQRVRPPAQSRQKSEQQEVPHSHASGFKFAANATAGIPQDRRANQQDAHVPAARYKLEIIEDSRTDHAKRQRGYSYDASADISRPAVDDRQGQETEQRRTEIDREPANS